MMPARPVRMTSSQVAAIVAVYLRQGNVLCAIDIDHTMLEPGKEEEARTVLAAYRQIPNWRWLAITGRSPYEAHGLLKNPDIAYFGDMGMAWIGFPGPVHEEEAVSIHPRAQPFMEQRAQLARNLAPCITMTGVQLIWKTTGLALNCGTPENMQRVQQRLHPLLKSEALKGWRVEPSRRTLAFMPRCGVHKGTALREAFWHYRPTLLLVAGDSSCDEALFITARTLEVLGPVVVITIAVQGSGNTDALLEQANCTVQDVQALHGLLAVIQAHA